MAYAGVRGKYGNRKTEVDGILFDSAAEARRYRELRLLERAGEIDRLELQPSWPIVIDGVRVCTYRADFRYFETLTGRDVIEDVKGVRTPVYRIKAKLMLAVWGLKITEVEA